MNRNTANNIAISGLQFIAGDSEQLSRFVALSGVSPDEMRSMAQSPEFMIAVLDYFLADEPTLLAFATGSDINPEDISKAKFALDPHSFAEF